MTWVNARMGHMIQVSENRSGCCAGRTYWRYGSSPVNWIVVSS